MYHPLCILGNRGGLIFFQDPSWMTKWTHYPSSMVKSPGKKQRTTCGRPAWSTACTSYDRAGTTWEALRSLSPSQTAATITASKDKPMKHTLFLGGRPTSTLWMWLITIPRWWMAWCRCWRGPATGPRTWNQRLDCLRTWRRSWSESMCSRHGTCRWVTMDTPTSAHFLFHLYLVLSLHQFCVDILRKSFRLMFTFTHQLGEGRESKAGDMTS